MELHRLPSEIEELPVAEFWELLAAFKARAEEFEAARKEKS